MRKEKEYNFIYKTTNMLDSKYYIGMHSTDNLEDGYLGSGRRLRRAIRKYGKDNFKKEVLEFVDSREELKNREEEIVNLDLIAREECMNLMVGGVGGFISVEQQRHRSQCGGKAYAEKLKNDEEFRKKHIDIAKERLRTYMAKGTHNHNTFEGRSHSDETKEKMRNAASLRTGNKNSQFGTTWINKDGVPKKIKKEDLPSFTKKGWKKGRK